MDDIIRLLHETGLVRDIPDEDVRSLAAMSSKHSYTQGSVILKEDDHSRDLYMIRKGRVSIALKITPAEAERKQVIFTLHQGDVLGEMSLVDGSPRSATVNAEDNVVLYSIEYSGLISYLESNPMVGYIFMRNIAGIIANRTRNTNMLWRNLMIW